MTLGATSTAYERLLERLRDDGKLVRPTGPNKAVAQCPAHQDSDPSLAITKIEGQVLVHCHAYCDINDVLAAVGLSTRDLFDDRQGAVYHYDNGIKAHRTWEKKFWQERNNQPPELYRLSKVKAANTEGKTIWLVAGEKDVHTIESLGEVGTTGLGGEGNIHLVDLTPLHGANVIAIADRDAAGAKWARTVKRLLDGKAQSINFLIAKTGKDISDHIAAGLTLDDLQPADPPPPTEGEEEDAYAATRRLLPRIDWHELWANDDEEEWILYPLVPARRLVALYSPAKVGKSLLMLEVAVAISRGERALGHQPTKRWRVLYVDFENDPRGDIRSRLQDMGYGPDDLDYLDYLSFPVLSALDSSRGALELMAAIHAYESEIVIVDTISRAVAGEENDNDTWLDFYRHTGLALKQAGVALIRLDHTGKDEAKGQRGGSAKSGDVDAIWRLSRVTDERFKIECTDARFPLEVKLLELVRLNDPLRHAVENLSAVTEREMKIEHITELANQAGLPPDAGRVEIQAIAKERGVKARTTIYSEVAKRRKAAALKRFKVVPGPVPTPPPLGTTPASEDTGNNPEQQPDLRLETVPKHTGTNGNTHIGSTVPVPPPIGGNSGTTEHNLCLGCGYPLHSSQIEAGETTHPTC